MVTRAGLFMGVLLVAIAATGVAGAQESLQTDDSPSGARPEAVHARWATFEPQFREHTCPFPNNTRYDTKRVTCGYVLVPEDRTDPDSRLIKLTVMKVAARRERSPDLTVVLLTGGPGFPVEFASVAKRLEEFSFTEHGDFVTFDQRGVGYSEASFCRGVAAPSSRGVRMVPDALAQFNDDLRRCLSEAREQGIAVDAYSTWHNAHDVRDIRRALGYARWNLWGVSAGARLGLAVMPVDETGTRAALLDSPVPTVYPVDSPWGDVAVGLRSSLDAINDACAQHTRCSEDVGDFRSRIEPLLAVYQAEPLILEHVDEGRFRDGRLVVDGNYLANSLFSALYWAWVYRDLPIVLAAFENRDAEAIKAYAEFGLPPATHAFGAGLNLVSLCRGDLHAASEAARIAEPSLSRWHLAFGMGETRAKICEDVYRVAPDASVLQLESEIPTLVLSGEADPITPPALARSVLSGLTNATYLEFSHVGHDVIDALSASAPDCADALLAEFLADPAAQVDESCVDAVPPPDFLTRVRETKGPFRFVSSLSSGAPPLAPTLLAVGLLFAVVAFPVAAVGRRVDGQTTQPIAGKARLLAWCGATMSAAAGVVAAWSIFATVTEHPLALPVGVLPWIAWAGWLSLAGTLLAAAAAVACFRRGGTQRIGTTVGVLLTAALSASFLVFLVSVGAGPV